MPVSLRLKRHVHNSPRLDCAQCVKLTMRSALVKPQVSRWQFVEEALTVLHATGNLQAGRPKRHSNAADMLKRNSNAGCKTDFCGSVGDSRRMCWRACGMSWQSLQQAGRESTDLLAAWRGKGND